ncbi:MAG TPA: hypothetical protein VHX65_01775 [Pirellulales bacterium]|jgi:hypothetical protein|nr:hypothetical protein [Pirellulales bacterium]
MTAIEKLQMFNLIDVAGGEKVDFWLLSNEPFDQARFARRQSVEVDQLQFYVSSPEDTILAKLRWAKLCGRSEKQFTDALGVYELQRPVLDLSYLHEWVDRLNLQELWARIQNEAGPTDLPD